MKQRTKKSVQISVVILLGVTLLFVLNRQFRFIGHHDSGVLPADLFLEANAGRDVFGPDGDFALPDHVTNVMVDVGAHLLQVTGEWLIKDPHLAVLAIEPQKEAWEGWPKDIERLIAIPVAIDVEEGMANFNVNVDNSTSSLLESDEDSWSADLTRTVEVREVYVFRLDTILEKIPDHIAITLIKVDVQGKDLQVLKSAGDLIKRARFVRSEVLLKAAYKGSGDDRPGTEKEFIDYMTSQGFALGRRLEIYPDQEQEDLLFINKNWRE